MSPDCSTEILSPGCISGLSFASADFSDRAIGWPGSSRRVILTSFAAVGVSPPAAETKSSSRCDPIRGDRKSTRLNSSHVKISYAVFCLKKKKKKKKKKTKKKKNKK